jgi:hypothetical protein
MTAEAYFLIQYCSFTVQLPTAISVHEQKLLDNLNVCETSLHDKMLRKICSDFIIKMSSLHMVISNVVEHFC